MALRDDDRLCLVHEDEESAEPPNPLLTWASSKLRHDNIEIANCDSHEYRTRKELPG